MRALEAGPWPAEPGLAVRMGLHTGQASLCGIRSCGYRVGRRLDQTVVAALGRPIRAEPDGEPLTMLDAGRLALDSIDCHLSGMTQPAASDYGTAGRDPT
jgi:hypothetical protein